jgi:hypothetical protein
MPSGRRLLVKRRRSQDVVRVRVPGDQPPVFHIPGAHGGWFVSLLFGFGTSVDVQVQDLRKLIGDSRGEVVIARRLTGAELKVFERERGDSDAAVHGHLVTKEELRFMRPRRRSRRA